MQSSTTLPENVLHVDHLNLRNFSWFKTGGCASRIYFPETIDSMAVLIAKLHACGIPFKVIGETTNLLFLDDRKYGVLISTTKLSEIIYCPDRKEITAEAGYPLPDLSRFALKHSIKGFAGLEGIPGTIGGAVFMNASAFGYCIGDCLTRVEIIRPDGAMETLEKDDLKLSHRDSVFKSGRHPGTVCRAFFRAEIGDRKSIYRVMEDFHARRHRSFEYMYPNLGSIFAGSVYRSMAKKDLYFRICGALFYFFGHRLNSLGMETPLNRKWLNDIAVKRFGLKFDNQPFSDKSLNVLINNNHHTDEILEYIHRMKEIIGNDVPIENEIVEPF